MTMWFYFSENCYYCTSSRRVYSLLRKLRATDLSCDTSGPLSLSNGSSYKSPFRLLVRWSLDFDAYKPSRKHYHLIVLPDGSGATVWLTLENRRDDLSQRNGSTVPAQRTVTTFPLNDLRTSVFLLKCPARRPWTTCPSDPQPSTRASSRMASGERRRSASWFSWRTSSLNESARIVPQVVDISTGNDIT